MFFLFVFVTRFIRVELIWSVCVWMHRLCFNKVLSICLLKNEWYKELFKA